MKKMGRPTREETARKLEVLTLKKSELNSSNADNTSNNPNDDSQRRTGRVKKVKKVFDPSDNYIPKKRIRPDSIKPTNINTESSGHLDVDGDENDSQQKHQAEKSPTASNNNKITSVEKKTELMQPSLKKVIDVSTIAAKEKYEYQKDSDEDYEDYLTKRNERREKKRRIKIHRTQRCLICESASNFSKMIPCQDCDSRAHISCMKVNFVNRKSLEANWRCDQCKTCEICYETWEVGILVTCCVCAKNYHSSCHVPKITLNKKFNKSNWKCTRCAAHEITQQKIPANSEDVHLPKNSMATSCSNAAFETFVNEYNENKSKNSKPQFESNIMNEDNQVRKKLTMKINKNDAIPDVSAWSCGQLTNFIAEIFPEEADVFKDQEIDGACLLLMTRSDVVTGLGLKLGPALRLYNFIVNLQSRKCDEYATWHY